MRFILLSLLLCLSGVAESAAAQDLYSGSIPVQGQGEPERRQALPAALLQVLQKLSGNASIEPSPALETALDDVRGYLLTFQYRDQERSLPNGETERELQLVASFIPTKVDRLVRDLGLPRWRPERSPVVAWIVVDDGTGRQLMPLEYQYAFDHMEEIASRRGLPIAWPGLSEELAEQMDLQLLWGGFTEQLLSSQSRSEGVVVVAARREGPAWNLRWTYDDGESASSWRTRNTDLAQALAEGAKQLTDLVASVNAIGPAGQGAWRDELLVAGLGGSADYARCLQYLVGLSLVDEVQVVSLGPEGVRFSLALNVAPEYLESVLLQDGVLEPEPDSVADQYRLVP